MFYFSKCLPQTIAQCGPPGRECFSLLPRTDPDCIVSCEGLYADWTYANITLASVQNTQSALNALQEDYNQFKKAFAQNLVFDASSNMTTIPYKPMQLVQIFFSTATYDNMHFDVSVTFEAQLAVIGGFTGLFAGFSVLSAVEFIYFFLKFCFVTCGKGK